MEAIKAETTLKALFIFLFIKVDIVYGAPPLVTDDAYVIAEGSWEYILSVTGDSRAAEDAVELPALEVNYGLFETAQITAIIARQVLDERGDSSRSGWGYGQLGSKWRFYSRDTWGLAFAPTYSFPISGSSQIRGLIEDVRVFSLPLIGTLTQNRWEFSAQAGPEITSTRSNGIIYGLAMGYALTDALKLLAEVYGEELSGDDIDEGITNWRAGLTWQFLPAFHLLAAWGGNIQSHLPGDEKLDYEYFLGLQYNTE